jgi:hypothetical protein
MLHPAGRIGDGAVTAILIPATSVATVYSSASAWRDSNGSPEGAETLPGDSDERGQLHNYLAI